jgi:hypothetical protein
MKAKEDLGLKPKKVRKVSRLVLTGLKKSKPEVHSDRPYFNVARNKSILKVNQSQLSTERSNSTKGNNDCFEKLDSNEKGVRFSTEVLEEEKAEEKPKKKKGVQIMLPEVVKQNPKRKSSIDRARDQKIMEKRRKSRYELPEQVDSTEHTFSSKARGNAKKLYVSDYINMKDMQLQEYLLDYEDYKEGVIRKVDLDEKSSKMKNVLLTEQRLYQTEVDQFDPFNTKQMGEYFQEADKEIQMTDMNKQERNIFVCSKQQSYEAKKQAAALQQSQKRLPILKSSKKNVDSLETRMRIGKDDCNRSDSSDDESMTSQTEAKLDHYYKTTHELQGRVLDQFENKSGNFFTKTLKNLIKIEEITMAISQTNDQKMKNKKIV